MILLIVITITVITGTDEGVLHAIRVVLQASSHGIYAQFG